MTGHNGIASLQALQMPNVPGEYNITAKAWMEPTQYNGNVNDLLEEVTFTLNVQGSGGGQPCPGTPTITDADGNVYNTVQIGNQCWMKENLNVGSRINSPQHMTNNGVIEKYCYQNDPSNCEIYGGLYTWIEMMQYTYQEGSQGICPIGWHIPTDSEWCELSTFIDNSVDCGIIGWTGTDIGPKMKSSTGWFNGGGGIDMYGFKALPSGHYSHWDTKYWALGWAFQTWSSTANPYPLAWVVDTRHEIGRFNSYGLTSWSPGIAVRCVKD